MSATAPTTPLDPNAGLTETAVLPDERSAETAPAAGATGSPDAAAIPTPAQPSPAPVDPRPEQTRAFAITSFVLGIVSVASGWTFFAPITGLVLGLIALRRRPAERAITLWGVWLNAAMLIVWAFFALVGGAFLLLSIAAAGSAAF